MFTRLLLASALAMGLSASVQAQYGNAYRRQPVRQPQAAPQPAEVQGTVEQVGRGGIMLIDDKKQPWQVSVPPPPAAKVQVTGTAEIDYLQPGLIVELKGEVDEKGALKDKVSELTVVTVSAEKKMGLFSPDSDQAGTEDAAASKSKGGKAAKRPAGAISAGNYRIVGRLTGVHGGKLSLQAGRGKLTLELAEQPVISVDMSDYSMAVKGDKISVKGMKMPARSGSALAATEVKIELAAPLSGPKKKGPAAKK